MPDAETRLHTVPGPPETNKSGGGGEPSSSRAAMLLGVALSVALVLLVWSRLQLGNRIDVLETEARALKQTVVDREATIAEQRATIASQEERLGGVRAGVEALLDLLRQPVGNDR